MSKKRWMQHAPSRKSLPGPGQRRPGHDQIYGKALPQGTYESYDRSEANPEPMPRATARSIPKPCRSGLSGQTDEGQGPSVTSPKSAASSAHETSEFLKRVRESACKLFRTTFRADVLSLAGPALFCGLAAREIAPWPRPRLVGRLSQIPQFAKV